MKRIILAVFFLFLCLFGTEAYAFDLKTHAKEKKVSSDTLNLVKAFGPKIAKDNQMECLNAGTGAIVDAKKGLWGINLKADRQWTIEEARPVIVNMAQEFINLIYKHPIFKTYTAQRHKAMPLIHTSEFGIDRFGIKLAFWDKNFDRPLPPFVAQIKVVDGNILYFLADPKDQSLQKPPFSESIEEAFVRANRTLIIPSPQSDKPVL